MNDVVSITTAIIAAATFTVAVVTLVYTVLHSHRIVREDLKYSYFPSPALRIALLRCQQKIWNHPRYMGVLAPEGWTSKEIAKVENLILKDAMIGSLSGLEIFGSLKSLVIQGINCRDICFHGYANLEVLCIADVSVETVRIENCPNLKTVIFGTCPSLLKMRIFGNKSLKSVILSQSAKQTFVAGNDADAQRESIDAALSDGCWLFSQAKSASQEKDDLKQEIILPSLEMLLFGGNGIAPKIEDVELQLSLNVSSLDALVSLHCSDSNLTSLLGLREKARLEVVKCGSNSFKLIEIECCQKLREFGCPNNKGTVAVFFSECPSLKEVWIFNSEIRGNALDFKGCSSLEKVWCQNCSLKMLEFCPSGRLRYVNCANNHLSRSSLPDQSDLKIANITRNLETLIISGQSLTDEWLVSNVEQMSAIFSQVPSLMTLEVSLVSGVDETDFALDDQWSIRRGVVQESDALSVRICRTSA